MKFSVCVIGFLLPAMTVQGAGPSFLGTLHHLTTVAATVPSNGDLNPYGVAVVPVTAGALVQGNLLVSNFNNSANLQGTGTTIMQISRTGGVTTFAQLNAGSLPGSCPGGVGLTTALVALQSGWVIVGSLPTTDGSASTAQAGCLIVLNSSGQAVETFSGAGINGPWDMTALDMGTSAVLFVANVLNGTVAAGGQTVAHGSVLRMALSIPTGQMPAEVSRTVIASSFPERTDPGALVIGPTGLALAADGRLFVADTLQSRIAAIPNAVSRTSDAGAGTTIAEGAPLNQPLGLTIAPNGDIMTVNAANGLMVETTPAGMQAGARSVDLSHSRNGAGTLFGLAIAPNGSGVYFVNDGNNTLDLLQ